MISRTTLLSLLFCAFGSLAFAEPPPAKQINILFILADQYRFDCIGANGNAKIHTPNLDRLAGQGASFQRAYVAQPVCSPNRSSILTGLYPHSAGVQENNTPLPGSSRTLAEMLQPAGYDCGYFGKWHLGRRDAFATMPEYPGDGRGNSHFFGQGAKRRYAVDVITEDAIRFIREKRDKPFYAYVSYYPPHPPFSVPPEYEERYRDIKERDRRVYYAMCTKIDESIGKLTGVLDELKLADRTIVVFTADHGHNFEKRWNHHDKRLCYDTAARLPLAMRFSGVIPGGGKPDGLISSVDLVPTLLSLAGQKIPGGLQGLDLADFVRGNRKDGRPYVLMENVPFPYRREEGEERCVLDSQWKLILSTRRPPELYEYRAEPAEKDNRWDKMKGNEEVATLKAALAKWADQTKDDLAPKLLEESKK